MCRLKVQKSHNATNVQTVRPSHFGQRWAANIINSASINERPTIHIAYPQVLHLQTTTSFHCAFKKLLILAKLILFNNQYEMASENVFSHLLEHSGKAGRIVSLQGSH